MSVMSQWFDNLLGRGSAATTVPILDGRLKPNALLDGAEVIASLQDANDMVVDADSLLIAAGSVVHRYHPDKGLFEICRFDAPVTAIAALGGDAFAVALAGQEVRVIGGKSDGKSWQAAGNVPFRSVNALALHDGRLFATDGSTGHGVDEWSRDLMDIGHSGRLLALDDKGVEVMRSGLRYAFGVCDVDGSVWFSESWKHRVDKFDATGHWNLWDRLPGYPCRMSPASGGGVWLSIFARRTQLVEFVLREPAYRKRMMASIDPRYWIAPAFSSGNSVLEPRQAGGIRQMGVLKPWAPPRSYGLIVRLSKDGLPMMSVHSRVGGTNHGIVATAELNGQLYALSKGAGRLLRLDIATIEQECLK